MITRRKIRVRRPLASILLGVLTTYLVAWACVLLPPAHAWRGPPTTTPLGIGREEPYKLWELSRGDEFGHTVVTYWHMQLSGRSFMIPDEDYQRRKYDWESLPREFRPDDLGDLHMQAWFHSAGWPMRAVSGSVHWQRQVRNEDILYTVRGGVQLARDASFRPRALPLMPVWTGFLANTALAAAAWWFVLCGLSIARARSRRRRCLCVTCKYDRAGLDAMAACPECGTDPSITQLGPRS